MREVINKTERRRKPVALNLKLALAFWNSLCYHASNLQKGYLPLTRISFAAAYYFFSFTYFYGKGCSGLAASS
jgi:hypothetical protein